MATKENNSNTKNIDKLLTFLLKEEEYAWQELLYELVRQEEMDPWDIDISVLVKRFIEVFKRARDLDFKIPGKVVLACAILLRMQSKRMLEVDVSYLDSLISGEEPYYDMETSSNIVVEAFTGEKPVLVPRIPQPRKRKISIFDLVKALEKALEAEQRRALRRKAVKIPVPKRKKKMEISQLIKKVYAAIKKLSKKKKVIKFDELLPKKEKQEVIYTFLPLLYLESDQKIEIHQEKPFDEIEILLLPGRK